MEQTPQTQRDLSPKTVHDRLLHHEIVLIDVREPQEYAAERIHGALLFPLSTFDPAALPFSEGRPVVLQCGSGKRSAAALAACAAAGVPVRQHMQGGISAWKAAGLPTVKLEPATGRVLDRGP
jgi:rhodanese-related sulfurtransferase